MRTLGLAVAVKPPYQGASARRPLSSPKDWLAGQSLSGLAGLADVSQRPRINGLLRHAGGSQPLLKLLSPVRIVKAPGTSGLESCLVASG